MLRAAGLLTPTYVHPHTHWRLSLAHNVWKEPLIEAAVKNASFVEEEAANWETASRSYRKVIWQWPLTTTIPHSKPSSTTDAGMIPMGAIASNVGKIMQEDVIRNIIIENTDPHTQTPIG